MIEINTFVLTDGIIKEQYDLQLSQVDRCRAAAMATWLINFNAHPFPLNIPTAWKLGTPIKEFQFRQCDDNKIIFPIKYQVTDLRAQHISNSHYGSSSDSSHAWSHAPCEHCRTRGLTEHSIDCSEEAHVRIDPALAHICGRNRDRSGATPLQLAEKAGHVCSRGSSSGSSRGWFMILQQASLN